VLFVEERELEAGTRELIGLAGIMICAQPSNRNQTAGIKSFPIRAV